jgi:hypothetical protein
MPVNRCRAAPRLSLPVADSESLSQSSAAAAGVIVSPSLDSTCKECFAANELSRSISLLVLRRTSDTSQKVPCYTSVDFTVYIPCINQKYYHEMNARSAVV